MNDLHEICQACQRPASPAALAYRKGDRLVSHDSFLQCDVCERLLCADCLATPREGFAEYRTSVRI